jgi:hypothetical protein
MIKVIDSVMGAGKAQRYSDLVFTESGYKTIKDLKEGELIYGEDGKLHKLLYKTPQGVKDVYKVTFSDGTSTVCCDEHLWTYQNPKDKLINKFRTNSLKEIMQMKLYKDTNRGDKNWQIFIPITKPLEFKESILELNPYLLGLLIGDGGFTDTSISFTNSEKDIYKSIKNLLPNDELEIKNRSINSKNEYVIVKKSGKFNSLRQILKKYDLCGKLSYEKHIPKDYLFSSINQRIDLLSGLIDTDGSIINNIYTFSTTSKQLKDDVIFLVQSLGGTSHCLEMNTKYTYKNELLNGRLSYKLTIRLPQDIIAFKSEKHNKKYKKGNTNPNRSIRSIEYLGKEDCCCIKTSNPTSLYLTNDMIVTHNSSWAMKYINNNPDRRFIYVTPYLDEVERCCKICKAEQPERVKGSKINSFKQMISKNINIATTHELFKLVDNETIELLNNTNYSLILDEVLEVVEETTMKKGDIDNLIKLNILKEENGQLVMGDKDVVKEKSEIPNEYQQIAINLIRKNLEILNGDKKIALLWLFPIDLLKAFEEVYMMTFCFDGYPISGYLKIHKIEVEKYSIETINKDDEYNNRIFKLVPYVKHNTDNIKKLLNIIDVGKINDWGSDDNALSFTWWKTRSDKESHMDWIVLKKSINNVINNYISTKSKNKILWTCFQNARSGLYTKVLDDENFIAHNLRATNKYKDRVVVLYLINRKHNPIIKNWLKSKGVSIDDDKYSLGEMIQLIWRSAIRENKPIDLYVPSKRMRNILISWLNNQ